MIAQPYKWIAQWYQCHDDMSQQETGATQPEQAQYKDEYVGKENLPPLQIIQVQIIPIVALVDE
jgi:hypothetical protein